MVLLMYRDLKPEMNDCKVDIAPVSGSEDSGSTPARAQVFLEETMAML
jgi:hypothetical protein